MDCLSPIKVPRFKCGKDVYSSVLLRHGLTPMDIPFYHLVPCGKCSACRLASGRKWTCRLLEKMNDSFNNYFITLTYTDEDLLALNYRQNDISQLNVDHLRNFLNRMKSALRAMSEKNLRKQGLSSKDAHRLSKYPCYFAIGDYGDTTFRPHYHVILYDCPCDMQDLYNHIQDWFGFGFIHDVRPLHAAHCSYVVKYLTSLSRSTEFAERNGLVMPFKLTSRGLMPSSQRVEQLAREYDNGYNYIQHGRCKYGIPSYLKGKISRARKIKDDASYLYAAYSELVKDSSNFAGFVDENNRVRAECMETSPYTESQKKYNDYLIKKMINN